MIRFRSDGEFKKREGIAHDSQESEVKQFQLNKTVHDPPCCRTSRFLRICIPRQQTRLSQP